MLLLAACSPSGEPAGQSEAQDDAAAPGAGAAAAGLTGLYESGAKGRPDQLCMIDEAKGARFGLVVWGAGLNSCSGTGTAERKGEGLRLRMTGDETCAIDARLEGGTVILPASIPEGCAYYCGSGASLANARFTRSGSSLADAARARDLVGDPLCGGN